MATEIEAGLDEGAEGEARGAFVGRAGGVEEVPFRTEVVVLGFVISGL